MQYLNILINLKNHEKVSFFKFVFNKLVYNNKCENA